MKKEKKISVLKKSTIALFAVAMIGTFAVPASAITLAESFYSSTSIVCVGSDIWGTKYYKTCTAGTKGYYNFAKRHYVHAYIGGSSKSSTGAIVDSKRRYNYGNVEAKVQTTPNYYSSTLDARWTIPTAYAKYDMEK